MGADRATIFIMSNDKSQLTLMMAEGAKEITVPVGVGIAGGVAETGANVNIPDCYEDRCSANQPSISRFLLSLICILKRASALLQPV